MLSNESMRASQLLSILVIVWFGANEILKGGMTMGDYIAFTAFAYYLSGSVKSLSYFHIMLQPLFASMERLMEMFSIVPECGQANKSKDLRKLPEVRGEITFENVAFCYDENEPVLNHISFTLTLHKNINFALYFGYAAFCRTSRKWDRSSRTVWLALMVRVSSPFGLMRRPAL
jgi:ABC-type bacteriocin/lantibiotic exporter with double-glycine peptidase domain